MLAGPPDREGSAMNKHIRNICDDAVAWLNTLSQYDADAAVDVLIERIITVLRRDTRMPSLTAEEWRLLFADAVARSRDELGELLDGKGDIDDAVDKIAETIGNKIVSRKRQKRKSATATTGARP
jgi:hypothetical protein